MAHSYIVINTIMLPSPHELEDFPHYERHMASRKGPFLIQLDKPVPPVPLRYRFIKWRLQAWEKIVGPFKCLWACPRSFHHGMLLLWPVPWHFRVPLQLSIEELMDNEDLLMQRKGTVANYTLLRKIPLFKARDTPLRCLYRLYEAVCAMSQNELMEESQYYFGEQPKWKLKDIPNPNDPDPRRQAILASLVETLVQSFNYKIFMGLRRGITRRKPWLIERFQREENPPYEEAPEWTALVEPLPETLKMNPEILRTPWKHFNKRNILVNVDSLWNF